jgi:hypothetical protein
MSIGSSLTGVTPANRASSTVKVFSRVEYADRRTFETRFYISSAALDIDRLANAVRGHWGVESMRWQLNTPGHASCWDRC